MSEMFILQRTVNTECKRETDVFGGLYNKAMVKSGLL